MDKQNKWNHINSDLKGALDTWEELTDKMANKLSPEEEQLREIKNILGTLKDKLKVFEEDETPTQAPGPVSVTDAPEKKTP